MAHLVMPLRRRQFPVAVRHAGQRAARAFILIAALGLAPVMAAPTDTPESGDPLSAEHGKPGDAAPVAALPAQASGATAPAKRPRAENYTLRQAITGWDMLSKVDVLCPDGDREREARRFKDLEAVANRRLKLSARAVLEKLQEEVPPVLMTPEQAVRVVANAGGCKTDALAQWRGRAAFVADTSRQVLDGEARADRQWPRDAALEQPLRITVLGQRSDARPGMSGTPGMSGAASVLATPGKQGAPGTPGASVVSGPGTASGVWLRMDNRGSTPVRFALLAPQTFIGLCTRLTVTGAPVEQGYAPREWLTLPPRGTTSVWIARDPSCQRQARVNVGGAAVIDSGAGPRYWRFLVRGVGAMPAGVQTP